MPDTDIFPPAGQRQVELASAGFFRPDAENPPANQVRLQAGVCYAGGHAILEQLTPQVTAGFPLVGIGFQRIDLVYIDNLGAAGFIQGTPVAFGTGLFQGAPGWVGAGTPGPALPDNITPIAWVFVDETAGSAIISPGDITEIKGMFQVTRDIDGYLVDKGLFGSPPAGTSDDVSALFAAESPGGSSTVLGIVTSAPENYVHLLDHKGDEIIHAATGSRIYGRGTEAATVWTLNYFYTSAAGAETAVADISTDAETTPTDLQLVGTPKTFSKNDPSRPLFDSNVARLSDQLVGDIPTATTTQEGKVLAAQASPSPAKAGAFNVFENNGTPLAGGPFHTVNWKEGGATSPGAGQVDIPVPAGVGTKLQETRTQLSNAQTTTGTIPDDDTVPTSAQGGALTSVAITPGNAANILKISWSIMLSPNAGTPTMLTLFKDAGAAALAVSRSNIDADSPTPVPGSFFVVAGGTISQTWALRYGTSVGATLTAQGVGGTRRHGATVKSFISVEEFSPP